MEMKYVEDPKVNKKVAEIIEELKKEIVSHFHPKSIIITGSFGRGEATVIEENGKLRFLSDCEIIIIPYKWVFNRKKLEEFEQGFYKRTGLKVEIWGFTLTLYLTIPFLNRMIKPTIANYDLKYGSKVIYGKNYLDKIPSFKSEDIPLWEGIRLILNRMAESLKYFSPENPTEEMVFWADKIILACQDALLLSISKYTSSVRERNKIFTEFLERFGISCIQTLAEIATEATNRKLNPFSNNIPPDKRVEYWFQVSRICNEVFRYILKTGCNIEFKDYLEFQEKYISSNIKNYTTLPLGNIILRNYFRFFKKKIVGYEIPTLRMLLRPHVPWDHLIYSLIPLVYFGIEENYKINAKYLKRVSKILSLLGKNVEITNCSLEDWMRARDAVISCWHQMQL